MASDLVPHPAVEELRWVHRPIATTRVGPVERVGRTGLPEAVTLRLTNRQDVRGTAWLRGTMDVLVDGVVVGQVRLPSPSTSPLTGRMTWSCRCRLRSAGRSRTIPGPRSAPSSASPAAPTSRGRRPVTWWPGTRSCCDRRGDQRRAAGRDGDEPPEVTAVVDPEGGGWSSSTPTAWRSWSIRSS